MSPRPRPRLHQEFVVECAGFSLLVRAYEWRDDLRYARVVKRAALAIATLLLCFACRRHGPELPVRVLYSSQNPSLGKLRQSERDFSFTDPRLRSGRPFAVRAITDNEPARAVTEKRKSSTFDLFILKSAAELPDVPELRKEVGDSFSVCGQAVAYIPDWVNEEQREGAARFLQYLSTHCR